jgi:type VI secretion system protein ImpA
MCIRDRNIVNAMDWKELLELCCTSLEKQSKNLEIACWLCEALVRVHGFVGLQEGFELLRELIVKYWPDIYPQEDEEGVQTKLATLIGLNGQESIGTLILPIQCVPLSSGDMAFGYWQYQQAIEIAKIANEDKREQRIQESGISLELIEASLFETPLNFLETLYDELQKCQSAFEQLEQALHNQCQQDTPSTSNISKALGICATTLQGFIDKKRQSVITKEVPEEIVKQATKGVCDSKLNREQALSTLLEIAQFFKEQEPHSPISYMLERTVRWGYMNLAELVQEIFVDPNAQYAYCKMVGIELPEVFQDAMPSNSKVPAMPGNF